MANYAWGVKTCYLKIFSVRWALEKNGHNMIKGKKKLI